MDSSGLNIASGLDKLKAKIDEDRRPTAPAAGLVPQPGARGRNLDAIERAALGGAAARYARRDRSRHACDRRRDACYRRRSARRSRGNRAGQWRSGCRHAGGSADRRSGHAGASRGPAAEEAGPRNAGRDNRIGDLRLSPGLSPRVSARRSVRGAFGCSTPVAWMTRRSEFATTSSGQQVMGATSPSASAPLSLSAR